jgi:hypothetical protein
MVTIFSNSLQIIPGCKEWPGCGGTVGFFKETNSPFAHTVKKFGPKKGSSTSATSIADVSSIGRLRGSSIRRASNFPAHVLIVVKMADSISVRISSSNA